MINSFGVNWSYVWRSTKDCSTSQYYDYDDLHFKSASDYKLDNHYGIFHVYESGNCLYVEVSPKDMPEFITMMDEALERMSYYSAEFEVFEPIWTNGLDFFTIDRIGALSEAPAFASLSYMPDWIANVRSMAHGYPEWMLPDYAAINWGESKVWSAIDYYQIKSPLDMIRETGKAYFTLAGE